jgi:hypothetical protein
MIVILSLPSLETRIVSALLLKVAIRNPIKHNLTKF